ncbi:tRNA (adenosine(37)-N6)-dimethylallyltransferase MiaA [bacterium]|jgi:tRNA dimethylallyltransferase|nr:tRNA (adenosine(37)-N6)-dimethylallyltransferase MiaA [bacterium]MBT4335494.1 tRNA (adenosine(37)-N6)-dimethylallyltransferase MiaA [bacterium]MBT4495489.1 tRNA (adenosine(37)-N6)-dimethylallyltransferase MiaA [bacterium]MBT4764336.1 tRNA (adenosine(37)-N6)-dimethylallyltransferase MiaA [bacterium]MBT5401707.1 tRNA (adenosine(37)-N6)-dimethylallyltransferase MiaA [bacterium]
MPKRAKNKVIAIVGPTACGKTNLAVKLAKAFNGEIISADSRQVYIGMNIGTGKDLNEYGNIKYHLIDVVSPKKQYSLAQFQKEAYKAIDDILKRNKLPIIAGGTGLYVDAITKGYILSQSKPNKELRNKLSKKTLKELQSIIKKYKLKVNESDFKNKRRLERLIEIHKTEKDFKPKNNPRYNVLTLGIKYPKEIIDKRIDKRLIERIEKEGMIQEVKKLHKKGVSYKRLEDFGLEYKYVSYYLKNIITYDELIKKLSIAIHQFAKRQLTWFKRDKQINWIKNITEAKNKVKRFIF